MKDSKRKILSDKGQVILASGVIGAFVAVAISLQRPATRDVAVSEMGPFRIFTQNETGRYTAGHNPDTQAGKPTASVYCFPEHPTAYVAGKQVQLDTATNQVALVVRGEDGKAQLQPAAAGLGVDIKAACTAIRHDADASGVVNRIAKKLVL